jgi:hypothetical protein
MATFTNVPYIFAKVVELANTALNVVKTVKAVQNANGVLTVFTLPGTVTDFDFTNFFCEAEINGVTFTGVSTLVGANAWDKVFTVADVAGTITLTFNYPPCQVTTANPYGQLEAVSASTNAPDTLTAIPVYVNYNGVA